MSKENEKKTNSYTVVDIETTGLNPKRDRIIEIAATKYEDGVEVAQFQTFVNPGIELDERIVELTGITDEMIKDAPYIQDVIGDFVTFETTGTLLGHHIIFDYSFLKRAAVNTGYSFEKVGIDTLVISRKYLQELESRSLPFLCKHFGIEHQPHRAMSDVVVTHELYKILMEKFPDCEESEPKQLVFQVKKESPITKKQIEQIKKLLSIHGLEMKQDFCTMTKNEASRFYDQIVGQYGRIPKRQS